MRRVCLVAPMAFVLLAGCGGGSGSSANPPSGEGVTISAITGPSQLQIGVKSSALQYKATVSGTSNTAVTWSVDDPSLATINATTGIVTPAASKTGRITITATAAADSTKKATLTVPVVNWILTGVLAMAVDADTGQFAILLQPSTTVLMEYCAWRYDHLAFACTMLPLTPSGTLPTQIGLFTTDGTAAGTSQTKLLDLKALGGMQFVENPHFSPDGTKLIFEGWGQTSASLPVWGAWTVNVDGQSAPVLAAASGNGLPTLFSTPRFTPDGTGITYDSDGVVWLVRTDGTNAHPLIAAPASNAVFTPDMSSVFYNANGTVYRAHGDGTNGVQVGISGDQILDVSPNGEFILVTNLSSTGVGNFIADLNGNGRRSVIGTVWASW